MHKTFKVDGSYGTLTIDDSGAILKRENEPEDDEESGYDNIERFDVQEYIQYNGRLDDTDILLIGYWNKDGSYEPPVYEYRKRIEKE